MAQIFTTPSSMRQWARQQHGQKRRVGLVPTMGALHLGHMALVREAQRHAERVVVSIFVNPLQFGPQEDLARYPQTPEDDLKLLDEFGVDAVFMPSVEEMYPLGPSLTRVSLERLASVLCGKSRPGHFQGVATVVAKLFHIVEPDTALFGQKDWQQLVIIRRLVADLNFPVEIIGVPTVREANGLAISSRNRYLSPADTSRAASLYRALRGALAAYQSGTRGREEIRRQVADSLSLSGIEAEYVEVVDPRTLEPSPEMLSGQTLVAVAARVGKARLIDNILLGQD